MLTRKNLIISFGFIILFVILSVINIHQYLVQIEKQKIAISTIRTENENLIIKELLNEQDITSYTAFTLDKLYSPESDIYKRSIIKLKGLKQKHLHSIIQNGLNHLNSSFKFEDFLIGFYRLNEINSYEYNLYYRYQINKCCTIVSLKRVFHLESQLVSVVSNTRNKKEIIHFILPLTNNKLNKLDTFLNNFNSINIDDDDHIRLTIVFNSLIKNSRKIDLILKNYKNLKIKLIHTSNKFSRANYLELGSDYHHNTDLLFFCDIDIIFTQLFLDLCRYNTQLGTKVYFPILYSFYNPSLSNQQNNFTFTDLNESGYWRHTGFGMVCLYKQDFTAINGFDAFNLKSSWGGEDIYLFRKFINNLNGINVIRSVAPGLFHLYHFKECTNLNHKACWNSKIMNEASWKTFGLIYFRNKMIN